MSEEKKEIKPIIPTLPGSPTYDSTLWGDTEAGKGALGSYNAAKDALNSQPGFSFSQNNWLNSVKNNIKNYGDFSYDFNADALYQQYKDRYIQQGKMAMADTIGQASAMTGGYGNSYAATVGNQAYQAHLNELNDVIPELYQLALERHNMGKQDLYNQYGLLMSEYEREYGKHSDEYNKLLDQLGIAKSDYYDGGNLHYSEQSNKNAITGQQFTDAMNIWNANNTNAWNQAEWDRDEERYQESKVSNIGSGNTVMYNTDGTVKEGYTTTNSSYFDDNGNFNKATFSRYDDNGNVVWYIGGKEVVRQAGANPYTGDKNPDTKYGTFDNGYQPNNVGGSKLSKSGITDSVNGVTQNVWKDTNGKLWIWDGTQNKYLYYGEQEKPKSSSSTKTPSVARGVSAKVTHTLN